ncbi:hypothetical protein A5893_16055 [Pedobacter psychrophilus]|uniref:DUF2064 domain-containing protein n=1 Tax=Pedobacter psychrophilus TaxID=1826909 RepID=A0A179DB74_9SPHI|nr:DUF2064 domain-containing protein [Pedobacter psychrophilus]OAQ38301.1 hypothetical protein A5893_16055 [Pedobacter psychrophilus]
MNKSAIILFAHLPDFDARSKSLSYLSSKTATKKISAYLTKHFYNLSKKTTADTFLIDTYHQNGKTFGERISNAFSSIYDKGYENVICIGNDCPNLTLENLQNALVETEKGNVVLGPTKDGGTYLMGVPKKHFNKSTFETIGWQTKKTYQNLISLFKESKSPVFKTSILFDIDNGKDFSVYFKENILVKIFINIIKKLEPKITVYHTLSFLRLILSETLLFRGPPPAFSAL